MVQSAACLRAGLGGKRNRKRRDDPLPSGPVPQIIFTIRIVRKGVDFVRLNHDGNLAEFGKSFAGRDTSPAASVNKCSSAIRIYGLTNMAATAALECAALAAEPMESTVVPGGRVDQSARG